MILVDLEVPSLGRIYNFNLDENAKIAILIDELVEMTCQKEHCCLLGKREELCICNRNGLIYDKELTLAQYGSVNGMNLLLI